MPQIRRSPSRFPAFSYKLTHHFANFSRKNVKTRFSIRKTHDIWLKLLQNLHFVFGRVLFLDFFEISLIKLENFDQTLDFLESALLEFIQNSVQEHITAVFEQMHDNIAQMIYIRIQITQ